MNDGLFSKDISLKSLLEQANRSSQNAPQEMKRANDDLRVDTSEDSSTERMTSTGTTKTVPISELNKKMNDLKVKGAPAGSLGHEKIKAMSQMPQIKEAADPNNADTAEYDITRIVADEEEATANG